MDSAWRKEPPTVDGWHWFRGSRAFNPICDEKPRPLGTKPLRVRINADRAQVDEDGRGCWVNAEWFVGEWAPCLPPSTPAPSFPAAVVDAAREIRWLNTGSIVHIGKLADCAAAISDLILATVPGDKGDAT